METLLAWISQYGYLGLFSLLVLGIVGLPVPDETLLTFCGYLIWNGTMHPAGASAAAFGGSATGITISYLLGRTYGHRVIYGYGKYIGLTKERLERVHAWFDRTGPWLLAIGYFVPGVRHFTAVVAGIAGLRWPVFACFAYSGAAVWVSVFLTLGYLVGDNWKRAVALVHEYTLEVTLLAIALLAAWWLIRRRWKKPPFGSKCV